MLLIEKYVVSKLSAIFGLIETASEPMINNR